MAGHHAARTQRMDLLDRVGQKSRNKNAPDRMGLCQSQRRKAETVLLARLPASLILAIPSARKTFSAGLPEPEDVPRRGLARSRVVPHSNWIKSLAEGAGVRAPLLRKRDFRRHPHPNRLPTKQPPPKLATGIFHEQT